MMDTKLFLLEVLASSTWTAMLRLKAMHVEGPCCWLHSGAAWPDPCPGA